MITTLDVPQHHCWSQSWNQTRLTGWPKLVWVVLPQTASECMYNVQEISALEHFFFSFVQVSQVVKRGKWWALNEVCFG